MKDKKSLSIRYSDLLNSDETTDPALERLIADLETIYPPISYPAALPEQLLSALETHLDRSEPPVVERPVADLRPRFSEQHYERQDKGWRRQLSTLIAAVLTILLVSSLVLVLHQSRQVGQTGASLSANSSSLITGVAMMNETTGWAESGGAQGSNFAVLHTTDGGFNWRNVTPLHLITPGYDASPQFEALDAKTAWAIGGGEKNQGVFFHTTNAGQTWQHVAFPAPLAGVSSLKDHIFFFHFLNDRVGWMSMQPDHSFWYTNNGGHTWRNIPIPSDMTQWGTITLFDEKTWAFTTAQSGASSTTSNGRPIIYITHDAGFTWHEQVLPVPSGLSFSAPMENLQSFSARNGILSIADGGEDILTYTTHDGGDSWQFTSPLSPGIIDHLYELGLPTFSDMSHGAFYVGPIPVYGKLPAPNYLIVTSDSGRHWQAISVQLPLIQHKQPGSRDRAFSECVFLSPQVGWLSVYYAPSQPGLPRSGLYKTVDGGKTWMAIPYHVENNP